MNKNIHISGAIGVSVFDYNGNNIFLYYDDHSNKNKYCEKKPNSSDIHLFIGDYFNWIIKSYEKYNKNINGCTNLYNLFIEELYISNKTKFNYLDEKKKLTFLWNNTEHLKNFSKFFDENVHKCYVHPTDIRNKLIHTSIMYIINKEIKITLYSFLYPILYFYDIINEDKIEIDKNDEMFKIIKEIKKDFVIAMNKLDKATKYLFIIKLYTVMIDRINTFYNKYKKYNNDNLEDIIKNEKNEVNRIIFGYPINYIEMSFIDEYHLILDTTMELYTLIKILGNIKKVNLVYYGFIHGCNFHYFLVNIFNSKILYENGITTNIVTDNLKEHIIKASKIIIKNSCSVHPLNIILNN
jgi:hypothetical protein